MSEPDKRVSVIEKKLQAKGQKFEKGLKGFETNLQKINSQQVEEFVSLEELVLLESSMMNIANLLYELIQESKRICYPLREDGQSDNDDLKKSESTYQEHKSVIPAAYEIIIKTGEWLETEFIYLLTYAYVPIKEKESKKRLFTMLEELKDSELKKYWQNNLPFILAKLALRLEDAEKESIDKNTKTFQAGKELQTIELGSLLLNDLYQYIGNYQAIN